MASPGLPLCVPMRLRPARLAAVQLATVAPAAEVEDRSTATASDLAQAVVLAHPLGGGSAPRICPPRRRRATCRSSASAVGTKARVSPRAFTNSGIRAPSVAPPQPRRRIPDRGRHRQISTDLSCRPHRSSWPTPRPRPDGFLAEKTRRCEALAATLLKGAVRLDEVTRLKNPASLRVALLASLVAVTMGQELTAALQRSPEPENEAEPPPIVPSRPRATGPKTRPDEPAAPATGFSPLRSTGPSRGRSARAR